MGDGYLNKPGDGQSANNAYNTAFQNAQARLSPEAMQYLQKNADAGNTYSRLSQGGSNQRTFEGVPQQGVMDTRPAQPVQVAQPGAAMPPLYGTISLRGGLQNASSPDLYNYYGQGTISHTGKLSWDRSNGQPVWTVCDDPQATNPRDFRAIPGRNLPDGGVAFDVPYNSGNSHWGQRTDHIEIHFPSSKYPIERRDGSLQAHVTSFYANSTTQIPNAEFYATAQVTPDNQPFFQPPMQQAYNSGDQNARELREGLGGVPMAPNGVTGEVQRNNTMPGNGYSTSTEQQLASENAQLKQQLNQQKQHKPGFVESLGKLLNSRPVNTGLRFAGAAAQQYMYNKQFSGGRGMNPANLINRALNNGRVNNPYYNQPYNQPYNMPYNNMPMNGYYPNGMPMNGYYPNGRPR